MLEMIYYNDLNLSNSGGCILVKVVMVMVGEGGGGVMEVGEGGVGEVGGPPKPP